MSASRGDRCVAFTHPPLRRRGGRRRGLGCLRNHRWQDARLEAERNQRPRSHQEDRERVWGDAPNLPSGATQMTWLGRTGRGLRVDWSRLDRGPSTSAGHTHDDSVVMLFAALYAFFKSTSTAASLTPASRATACG